jgi:hypothetical protein
VDFLLQSRNPPLAVFAKRASCAIWRFRLTGLILLSDFAEMSRLFFASVSRLPAGAHSKRRSTFAKLRSGSAAVRSVYKGDA